MLTNPSFKEDWVKIGKSSRPVDIRSKELDNTAVPLPFEVYATLKTVKYSEAEKLIHHYIERFTNLRIRNNREFFNVAPEVALAIFKEVALLLDDAEIDEVFKNVVVGKMTQNTTEKAATLRKEANTWILPANKKFFDIDACMEKYSEVLWTQNYKLQKGDIVYIYILQIQIVALNTNYRLRLTMLYTTKTLTKNESSMLTRKILKPPRHIIVLQCLNLSPKVIRTKCH